VSCLGHVWKQSQLQDTSNDFFFCENDLIRVFGGGLLLCVPRDRRLFAEAKPRAALKRPQEALGVP
jgi:hypothetical protein